MQNTINRILIIRPCAIGDFVQTLPALKVLRVAFPEAYIEISGNLSTIAIGKNSHYADSISRFDSPEMSYLFRKDGDSPQSLIDHVGSFNLVIVYLNDDENLLSANITSLGVDNVITFDPRPFNKLQMDESRHYEKQPVTPHIIDHLLKPVLSLGITENSIDKKSRIYISEEERIRAKSFLDKSCAYNNCGKKLVAIHPGSGSRKKNWPLQQFIEIAKYLLNSYDIKLLILSGPADELIMPVMRESLKREDVIFVESMQLESLVAVMEQADLYIGNDGGISHVTAAVGVQSLLIYGPTDPDIWAPRGSNVKIVRSGYKCAPCTPETMGTCDDQLCLEWIELDLVISQIDSLQLFSVI